MSFQFCDSFSHYATDDIPDKWSAWYAGGSQSTIVPSVGRHGSGIYRSGGGNGQLTLSRAYASNTVITGFAFRSSGGFTLNHGGIHSVCSPVGVHVVYGINLDGSLTAWQATLNSADLQTGVFLTEIGTTVPNLITIGIWYYLEFKTVIHGSAGSVEIRVNSVSQFSATGLNTVNPNYSTYTTATRAVFGQGGSGVADFCDLYVLDGGGAAPHNTFYGDIRIDCHYPTADGANTGSTPSSGSLRYAMVDEHAPNDDIDYNSVSGTAKDSFTMENLVPTGATIKSFQTVVAAKKTDSGAAVFKSLLRPVATDFDGSISNAPSNDIYRFYTQPYETNPATGLAITEAEFNAMEAGYHRTA